MKRTHEYEVDSRKKQAVERVLWLPADVWGIILYMCWSLTNHKSIITVSKTFYRIVMDIIFIRRLYNTGYLPPISPIPYGMIRVIINSNMVYPEHRYATKGLIVHDDRPLTQEQLHKLYYKALVSEDARPSVLTVVNTLNSTGRIVLDCPTLWLNGVMICLNH